MNPTEKPVWPHLNYCRLTAHPSGSWCKKIKGKLHYFGPLGDPDLALRRYLAFANASVNAQPTPEVVEKSQITINHAMNKFLTERRAAVESGELSAGQYARYRSITTHTLDTLGRERPFASLQPADFAILRKSLKGGPVTLKNRITWIRTILHWGEEYFGIKLAYGGQFDKPSRRAMQQGSKRRELFTPVEIQALLKHASPTTRCFVLLGINCAFGPGDIANIRKDEIDLAGGVHRHPRGKTSIPRICPLWPETVKALKEYKRPNVLLPDLFFVTRFGVPWVRESIKRDAAGVVKSTARTDAIAQEFEKLCKTAEVRYRGFYAFRHTFRSVADEVADVTAIECIMGHLKPGMGGVYTQLMGNGLARLKAVTDHVHKWSTQSASRRGANHSASRERPAR
jgi:integrase